MTNWAKSYNVELDFITKSSNLIEKINSYSQTSDLVTNLSVFSHGTASNIAFGYENTGYEYSLYDKTSINQLNVYQLSKKSFADNAMIHLYSCNSATPRGFEGKYFQSRKASQSPTKRTANSYKTQCSMLLIGGEVLQKSCIMRLVFLCGEQ